MTTLPREAKISFSQPGTFKSMTKLGGICDSFPGDIYIYILVIICADRQKESGWALKDI